jgi:putative nucleotidyltransferase with HDIG domain
MVSWAIMTNTDKSTNQIQRIAALLAAGDTAGLRAELVALLEQPDAIIGLCALDQTGLLTQIIPELEPARATDQPHVHFLPVLAHSLETVSAVEWLLNELQIAGNENREPRTTQKVPDREPENRRTEEPRTENHVEGDGNLKLKTQNLELPVAVQTHPDLRYQSAYAEELRRHFAEQIGRYPRAALFKLAALLHDIAKPATKQAKPGGGVSFHEHQTIGGEVALVVARRLGFSEEAARYIRLVVREHMRPGQLGVLDEVTQRAVARFFHATAGAGPDVLLHLLADHMATRGPQIKVAAWLQQAAWVDVLLDTIWGEQIEPTRPLLNGDELMRALGIASGPLVGRMLAAISQAQAEGEIGTAAEAIGLAKKILVKSKT